MPQNFPALRAGIHSTISPPPGASAAAAPAASVAAAAAAAAAASAASTFLWGRLCIETCTCRRWNCTVRREAAPDLADEHEGVALLRALAAVGRQPLALEVLERARVLVEEAEGRLEVPDGRLEQLLHHLSPRARVEGVGEVVLERRPRRVELEVGGDGLRCDLGAALRHAKLHPLSLSLSLSLPFDKIR
jgi:hypothetical protein